MNKLTKNTLTVGIILTCAFITHQAVAEVNNFTKAARCASFAAQLGNKQVVDSHITLAKLGLSHEDFLYQYGIGSGLVLAFSMVHKLDQVVISREIYKDAKCLELLPFKT